MSTHIVARAEVSPGTSPPTSLRFRPTQTRQWRHPNESDDNRLVYAIAETVLGYAARSYAHGRLVDIGCGEKPFAPIFAPHVSEHIGVDHPGTPHGVTALDIMSTAYDIPLPDGFADTILMSAVLEHLERPGDALGECHRLLTPGGHAVARRLDVEREGAVIRADPVGEHDETGDCVPEPGRLGQGPAPCLERRREPGADSAGERLERGDGVVVGARGPEGVELMPPVALDRILPNWSAMVRRNRTERRLVGAPLEN